MKKFFAFVLTLSLLFLTAVSCDSNSLEHVYTTAKSAYMIEEQTTTGTIKQPKIVAVDNETPYDELITKSIDIHYVIEKYFTQDLLAYPKFAEIAADIGVECLRKTDTYYSVHKVKQGGLFYLFYSDEEDPQKREVIRWFYSLKRLTKADFAGIKDGGSTLTELKEGESTIDDVKKIDPATQVFENVFHANSNYQKPGGGFGSWHLLDDGILEFGYLEGDKGLTVAGKVYWEDFALVQSNKSFFQKQYAKLLPMDWLPEES